MVRPVAEGVEAGAVGGRASADDSDMRAVVRLARTLDRGTAQLLLATVDYLTE